MAFHLNSLPQMESSTDLILPNTVESQMQVARFQTSAERRSYLEATGLAIPAVFASIVDTFASSLGLIDDDDVQDYLNANFRPLGEFFEDNRGAVDAVGGIVGAFIPGGLAIRAVRSGGIFARIATKTLGKDVARYVTSTGKVNAKLFQANFQRARIVARKAGGRTDLDDVLNLRNNRAIRRSVADVVIENIAADAAIAATMNQNDFLFPPEISFVENMIYFGAFNVAFGVAGYAAAKYTLRTGITRDAGLIAPGAQNPSKLPLSQVNAGVQDKRGPAISVYAAYLKTLDAQVARGTETQDKALVENAKNAKNAYRAAIGNVFKRLFNDSPIPGVSSVNKLDDASPELRTMHAAIDEDYLALDTVRSLESFNSALTREVVQGLETKKSQLVLNIKEAKRRLTNAAKRTGPRNAKLFATQKKKLQAFQDELDNLESTVSLVYEIDGTLMGALGRTGIWHDGERLIKQSPNGANQAVLGKTTLRSNAAGQLDSVVQDFDPRDALTDVQAFMGTPEFLKLSYAEKTMAQDLMQRAKERVLDNGFEKWNGMEVNTDVKSASLSHHTQLDFASSLAEVPGANFGTKIDGALNKGELAYASFASKWREFQMIRNDAAEAGARGLDHIYQNMDNVARALNLPTNMHATIQMFESQRLEYLATATRSTDILPIEALGKDIAQIRQRILETVDAEAGAELVGGAKLRGTMQDMPRDRRPVMGLVRNEENPYGIGRDQLVEKTLEIRASMINGLEQSAAVFDTTGKKIKHGTEIIATIVDAYKKQPDLVKAAKDALPRVVNTLNYGALTRQFFTRAFDLRDIEAAIPLDAMSEFLGRASAKSIEKLFKADSTMVKGQAADGTVTFFSRQELFNKLLARDAKGDLASFDVGVNAMRAGWDIAEQAVKVKVQGGKSVWQFELVGDSERNVKLWSRMFGEALPEGARLPDGLNGTKSLSLSELAFRNIEAFDQLSQQYLREQNALIKARGGRLIKQKAWHMPVEDFTNQNRVFLLDESGTVHTVVGGATAQQARSKAALEVKNSSVPLVRVEEQNMSLYYDATGRPFWEMDNFNKAAQQTGASKGRLAQDTITTGTASFQALLESLQRGFTDIGRETRMMLFTEELQFLKLQEARSGFAKSEEQNVYSLLMNRIMGTQNIPAESIPGKALNGIEATYDKLMQRAFDLVAKKRGTFGEPVRLTRDDRANTFKQLNEQLGQTHNPFNDFTDFMERTQKLELPAELRKHAGVLAEVTTAFTLRIADIGMFMVNITSLGSTLPVVINMLKRLPNETLEQQQFRTLSFGSVTPDGNGMFSWMRSLVSGAHFMYSKEGRTIRAEAQELGHLDQFAAETIESYTRTGEQAWSGYLRTATNVLSVPTDWSERFARGFSFMTFYNIGRKGMGLQKEAAMAFANKHANNTIADFRPGNRPVVFQGAAGMPFGLFTTFLWNYWQRLFTIAETQNVGAAISQFGLQAGLFGARSVPGAGAALEQLGTAYGDGSENLVDRLQRAFGGNVTDLLLNGSLSHFLGVGISNRASIGLPGERGFSPTALVPGFQLIDKLMRTAGQEADAFISQGGFDVGQAAEILARSNINKGLSNIIELVQGRSLDARGNTIEEFAPLGEVIASPIDTIRDDVQTRMAIGARLVGFKPLASDELRRENRRNRTTDRIRNELRAQLSQNLRSKVRRGRLRSADVEDALGTYVRAGGNPGNFRSYFNEQIVRANTSKLSLEIATALKNSADKNRLARLLFLSDEESR